MDEEKISGQIKLIQEEIKSTPYHKGTEHYIGRLRAKIARLEDWLLDKGQGRGGAAGGYLIKKEGDGTVVLVGFPSVGKSTLLNSLTSAKSKTAQYPFTTLRVVPGMMAYRGAKIQIFDVPGLIQGAWVGRGRGKEVLSVVRAADLILLLVDADNPGQARLIISELESAGIRVGQEKPEVIINKKAKGGILIKNSSNLKGLTVEIAKGIIEELGVKNAEVIIKSHQVGQRELIDIALGNRVYLPFLLVINKVDILKQDQIKKLGKNYPGAILVSALASRGLGELREALFKRLNFKRVYLKPRGGYPDFARPLIMKGQETVADVATRVGQILEGKRSAYVWGKSAKFPGQLVSDNHILVDEDIVSFRCR